jgi:hypothetical protein
MSYENWEQQYKERAQKSLSTAKNLKIWLNRRVKGIGSSRLECYYIYFKDSKTKIGSNA